MTNKGQDPGGADEGPVTVTVDGREYEFDHPVVTGAEIEDKAGIPRDAGLIRVLDDGTQEQVGEDERIELRPDDRFRKPPRFVRGADAAAAPGRRRDMELLRKRYPRVECGQDLGWFRIGDFPLPPGWNRESTDLLVIVPPGYPATPPDNFFVKPGLRTAAGAQPGNYTEGHSVLGESWAQFSFHIEGWVPGEDSLETFVIAAGRRLQEAN